MTNEELSALADELMLLANEVKIAASKCCGTRDMHRAARSMGVLEHGAVDTLAGPGRVEQVADLMYFEPNERGVRAFDRFLAGPARHLPEREKELAARMASNSFSIFRVAGKHESLGLWVDDILDNNRRIWLVEPDVEEEVAVNATFALRAFDAGPFHLPLCLSAIINERMSNVFQRARETGRPMHRRSLAATIYGLVQLNGVPPTHPSGWRFVEDLGTELRPGGT